MPTRARREALFATAYFTAYLGYLFVHPESELQHWVSLVLIPLAGLWLIRGRPRYFGMSSVHWDWRRASSSPA